MIYIQHLYYSAVPRDAIASKNVARQSADFPFGIIVNVVFISE